MNTSLTETAAQTSLVGFFTDTLQALPTGVALSRENPLPDYQSFSPGGAAPCDDSDQSDAGPVSVQYSLWLHGVPADSAPAYLEMILRGWDTLGWPTTRSTEGTIQVVQGTPADEYVLTAALNDVGNISVTGSSPCFPHANEGTTTPVPSTIPRPAG